MKSLALIIFCAGVLSSVIFFTSWRFEDQTEPYQEGKDGDWIETVSEFLLMFLALVCYFIGYSLESYIPTMIFAFLCTMSSFRSHFKGYPTSTRFAVVYRETQPIPYYSLKIAYLFFVWAASIYVPEMKLNAA
ncbi:MAG: hypothetical protein OEY68_10175 [Gammaproteobacteria bacterium]|nr:hypothetical protein [Gammaproteobacteria bacterium]